MDKIVVRGARQHNLKNIDVEIPKNKLVVITGPSGSGKSSLAFDTIYAEGQRRYVESLSSYARQFLGIMEKPDVDSIEGLSPAIAIDQKTTSKNPRSTVGTVTEIYDYLRVLWANVGKPFCPICGSLLSGMSAHEILERVVNKYEGKRIMVLAPIVRGKKGEFKELFKQIEKWGYTRVKVDGELVRVSEVPKLEKNKKHTIDLVLDRLTVSDEERARLLEAIEKSLEFASGLVKIEDVESGKEEIYSEKMVCPEHGFSIPEISPRLFSFNSPYGACPACKGLGVKWEVDPALLIDPERPAVKALKITDSGYFNYLRFPISNVIRKLGYSPSTPWKKLPESVRAAVLYGNESIGFEGVIRHLERRFLEEESERIREEIEDYIVEKPCPECKGARLRAEALAVKIEGKSIWDIVQMPVGKAKEFFEELLKKLEGKDRIVGERLLKEIIERLGFLVNVGLDYLSLSRSATTLSGGEMQRIRLATQLGSKLSGVLYVLDEPSIGLHPRDTTKLINTLKELRDLGNTVIVVEHDPETIESADHIIELGPGAGKYGGYLVAQGSVEDIKSNPNSLTGAYLSGRKEIPVPEKRRKPKEGYSIRIIGARQHNLKNINVEIPLGLFVCITGVSGSGKSTLVYEILYKYAKNYFLGTHEPVGEVDKIEGLENIDKVINIDQSPIGRTPRSNPATYTKVFDLIRNLFAQTPEAKARGYKPGRFSFNVKGGRCEACQGEGVIKVEMHFLPPVYITCEVCKGKRYNRETLEITYKGKNIADVLDMSVDEAYEFFENIPSIRRKLQILKDVGLGYIKLGQPAPTLSGGEAQRIKLARELSKKDTGRTLYLLDEPTTGLHMDDIKKLINVLQRLVDKGNTVVVIEHNLDVIKCADWVIDLGPEGGERGGEIVAVGTPEEVAQNPNSYTGRYLKRYLKLKEKVA